MPDLTISMTAPQAARVAAALGDAMGLEQPASMAEAKTFIIGRLKSITRAYERRQLEAAVTMQPDVDLT